MGVIFPFCHVAVSLCCARRSIVVRGGSYRRPLITFSLSSGCLVH
ncbi:unnamed protein product [Spirodela intermedia]|uniref:Uncharacterized protein n=1 Tax=Spirodela intermedia TaxID=51605 RepID=A0A7I8JDN7_SPIIN|nr:unnamed protein product [Spirodela intermedia]CAA6667492.1 unnamed protein product [Spirodela intermedia]